MSESESLTMATVTVYLEKVAEGVADYYLVMQEGQIAEMLGDPEKAFLQAKKTISAMAQILEGILGVDLVARVNDLAFGQAVAQLDAEDEARS